MRRDEIGIRIAPDYPHFDERRCLRESGDYGKSAHRVAAPVFTENEEMPLLPKPSTLPGGTHRRIASLDCTTRPTARCSASAAGETPKTSRPTEIALSASRLSRDAYRDARCHPRGKARQLC